MKTTFVKRGPDLMFAPIGGYMLDGYVGHRLLVSGSIGGSHRWTLYGGDLSFEEFPYHIIAQGTVDSEDLPQLERTLVANGFIAGLTLEALAKC